ncbi:MAG: hypothetical protein PF501_06815 [Salinisphaera sp.]|jgi:hypothetical protein|nr:hypothetical protein [Salinisphaera sp.]
MTYSRLNPLLFALAIGSASMLTACAFEPSGPNEEAPYAPSYPEYGYPGNYGYPYGEIARRPVSEPREREQREERRQAHENRRAESRESPQHEQHAEHGDDDD